MQNIASWFSSVHPRKMLDQEHSILYFMGGIKLTEWCVSSHLEPENILPCDPAKSWLVLFTQPFNENERNGVSRCSLSSFPGPLHGKSAIWYHVCAERPVTTPQQRFMQPLRKPRVPVEHLTDPPKPRCKR